MFHAWTTGGSNSIPEGMTTHIDGGILSDIINSGNIPEFPAVISMDTVNYLVFKTSYYTNTEMKAFKGLQAYQFFVAGKVHGARF